MINARTVLGRGMLIAALAAVAPAAHATVSSDTAATVQQDRTVPGKAGARKMADPRRRLLYLATRLDLTEEQQQRILPLLQDEAVQMKALRDDTSLDRKARWAKMKPIRTATIDKVRAVLTPDQQQKFDEMRKQLRERRGKCDKRGPAAETN